MYKDKKVSLVMPTCSEKDCVKGVILDFEKLGVFDEILMINNNAEEGTSEEIAQTNATEIHEPVQGYGSAIQRGLREATGDLIVICEPDSTFIAEDVYKFLAYSDDVDIVYGSRTIKNFIWRKANMGYFLKWGNWATAKLMEVLYNTNYLSDVGCTYRLINRKALNKMMPVFQVKTNFFSPEMMIIGYQLGFKCVQIPVNYKERIGASTITGDIYKAFKLGMKMIALIFFMRLGMHKSLVKALQ